MNPQLAAVPLEPGVDPAWGFGYTQSMKARILEFMAVELRIELVASEPSLAAHLGGLHAYSSREEVRDAYTQAWTAAMASAGQGLNQPVEAYAQTLDMAMYCATTPGPNALASTVTKFLDVRPSARPTMTSALIHRKLASIKGNLLIMAGQIV